MKPVALFAVLVLVAIENVHDAQAKVYKQCDLTRDLLNYGFERSFLGHWLCLINTESLRDTSKVTDKADRSKNLGIFQINSKAWCKFGSSGGKCNMKCEDLTNEIIFDDAACAKKVQGELGFRAWKGWMSSCYKRNLTLPRCPNIQNL